MSDTLQISITTVSILAGIFAIILVHQLGKKYRLPYLSTYFYFLTFLNIFGIYGIIGSRIIRNLLLNSGVSVDSVEYLNLFFIYLGIPFLILSLYMFLRLFREIVNKNLPSWFNLVYFGIMTLIFLCYGVILVKINRFGETRYDLIRHYVLIVFSVIAAVNCLYALIQQFILLTGLIDIKERRSVRFFGMFYFIIVTGIIVTINLAYLSVWIGFGFIILLFASHLLPILFLNIRLENYYVEPDIIQDFENAVEAFSMKFGISKREKEIIELINMGKSNQDISDSLFISLQTVKDHIHRIYLKTGAKNRVQLTNLIRSSQ